MASPSSSEKSNKNTEKSSSSSLPPLPPNIILSADHFSNQSHQNYDSGFQTAPSSPPPEPAAPPPPSSSSFRADFSVQSGSVTGISSPPSPETTKPSGPVPAILHGAINLFLFLISIFFFLGGKDFSFMFWLFLERDALPSHHLLKIKPFSTLLKAPIDKFSSEFEAGGYKWCVLLSFDTLVLYIT